MKKLKKKKRKHNETVAMRTELKAEDIPTELHTETTQDTNTVAGFKYKSITPKQKGKKKK